LSAPIAPSVRHEPSHAASRVTCKASARLDLTSRSRERAHCVMRVRDVPARAASPMQVSTASPFPGARRFCASLSARTRRPARRTSRAGLGFPRKVAVGWGVENNWQPSRRANTPDTPGGTRGSAWFRRKGKAMANPPVPVVPWRGGKAPTGGGGRRSAQGVSWPGRIRLWIAFGRPPTASSAGGISTCTCRPAANAGVTRGVWWVPGGSRPQLAALDRRRAPWHDFSFFF
jgi:hypothetical protein